MSDKFDKEIFRLICYMIVSARNLVEETKMYGPFRLIDACSRLIDILDKEDISNEVYRKIRDKIEDNKYKIMTDEEKFVTFMDDLILEVVGRLNSLNGDKTEGRPFL